MENTSFLCVVLPELSPRCVFYPTDQPFNFNQLNRDVEQFIAKYNMIKNKKKVNFGDYVLYTITPSWIERMDLNSFSFFSDVYSSKIPQYRIQYVKSNYPPKIFRFAVSANNRELDLHHWNVSIRKGSDFTLNHIIETFQKTFIMKCTDLKFVAENIDINKPVIEQSEILQNEEVTLTFNITDDEYKKAKKRVDVLKEIHDTEERYVNDLKLMTENFNEQLFEAHNIPLDVYKRTFKSVNEIYPIHKNFLDALKKVGYVLETSIGPLFLKYIPFFRVAAPHVANFSSTVQEITDLLKQNRSFEKAVNQICQTVFDGNTVESLLVTPVQRIPRYPLLLRELLKCTSDAHWDKPEIELAFDNLTKLTQEIDKKTSEQKNANTMASLQKKIGLRYNILANSRSFISKFANENDYLLLFNDLLLIITKFEDKTQFLEFPLITTKFSINNNNYCFITKKALYNCPINEQSKEFVDQFSTTKRDYLSKMCTFDGSLRWSIRNIEGPPKLKSACLVSLCSDMYLFGGKRLDGTASNDLWWFHDNTWELVITETAPTPRYDCTMHVYNYSLVVFGGQTDGHEALGDLLIFDIQSSIWTIIDAEDPPTPRFGYASAILDSQLWIYGGKDKHYLDDFYCFDFESKYWWKVETAHHPEPRAWATAFWLDRDTDSPKFSIFGGIYKSASYKSIWSFDYDAYDWHEVETVGDQPVPRYSHVSALYNDTLYVIGGRNMQDISLNSYRLVKQNNGFKWSAIPQSDEPESFESGCCCIIEGLGLALYRDDLYFINLEQKFEETVQPLPKVEKVAKNTFEGTRFSRPLFCIKANMVSTTVDEEQSSFQVKHHFENSNINLVMKKVDDHPKWKESAVIVLEGAYVDESFIIKDDLSLQNYNGKKNSLAAMNSSSMKNISIFTDQARSEAKFINNHMDRDEYIKYSINEVNHNQSQNDDIASKIIPRVLKDNKSMSSVDLIRKKNNTKIAHQELNHNLLETTQKEPSNNHENKAKPPLPASKLKDSQHHFFPHPVQHSKCSSIQNQNPPPQLQIHQDTINFNSQSRNSSPDSPKNTSFSLIHSPQSPRRHSVNNNTSKINFQDSSPANINKNAHSTSNFDIQPSSICQENQLKKPNLQPIIATENLPINKTDQIIPNQLQDSKSNQQPQADSKATQQPHPPNVPQQTKPTSKPTPQQQSSQPTQQASKQIQQAQQASKPVQQPQQASKQVQQPQQAQQASKPVQQAQPQQISKPVQQVQHGSKPSQQPQQAQQAQQPQQASKPSQPQQTSKLPQQASNPVQQPRQPQQASKPAQQVQQASKPQQQQTQQITRSSSQTAKTVSQTQQPQQTPITAQQLQPTFQPMQQIQPANRPSSQGTKTSSKTPMQLHNNMNASKPIEQDNKPSSQGTKASSQTQQQTNRISKAPHNPQQSLQTSKSVQHIQQSSKSGQLTQQNSKSMLQLQQDPKSVQQPQHQPQSSKSLQPTQQSKQASKQAQHLQQNSKPVQHTQQHSKSTLQLQQAPQPVQQRSSKSGQLTQQNSKSALQLQQTSKLQQQHSQQSFKSMQPIQQSQQSSKTGQLTQQNSKSTSQFQQNSKPVQQPQHPQQSSKSAQQASKPAQQSQELTKPVQHPQQFSKPIQPTQQSQHASQLVQQLQHPQQSSKSANQTLQISKLSQQSKAISQTQQSQRSSKNSQITQHSNVPASQAQSNAVIPHQHQNRPGTSMQRNGSKPPQTQASMPNMKLQQNQHAKQSQSQDLFNKPLTKQIKSKPTQHV